jgi:hypothetical protein
MSRWADFIARLLGATERGLAKPVRPRDVEAALEQHYDLDEYRRNHGGEAPSDAPHIPDDGTL